MPTNLGTFEYHFLSSSCSSLTLSDTSPQSIPLKSRSVYRRFRAEMVVIGRIDETIGRAHGYFVNVT
jgi:hypothetical protein